MAAKKPVKRTPARPSARERKPPKAKAEVVIHPGDGRPADERDGKKMTMFERVQTAMRIAAARGKTKPDTWPVIAKREGLHERTCYKILADFKRQQELQDDPTGMKILEETLALVTEDIALFAQAAMEGETWSVRVGAGRSLLDALKDRLALLAVFGKVPTSPQAASDRQRVQRMLRRMAEVLERRGADPELVRDLMAVIEDAPDEGAVPVRRELPSPAAAG